MIARILLSAGLMFAGFYMIAQRSVSRILKHSALAVIFSGLFLVWFPDLATWCANHIGIGRGADLIMYCWVLLTLFFLLAIRVRMSEMMRTLTELTRQIALQNAQLKQCRGRNGAEEPYGAQGSDEGSGKKAQ